MAARKLKIASGVKFDPPGAITALERKRQLDPKKVEALAQAIKTEGLLQPLHCRVVDRIAHNGATITGAIVLVAGYHRLAAAKKAKLQEVPWIDLHAPETEEGDLRCELWEIDENLIRGELTDLEQSQHHTRRKEILEALGKARKRGKPKGEKRTEKSSVQSYASQAAAELGTTDRTIRKAVKRGNAISPDVQDEILADDTLKEAVGDKGAELDALAKVPAEEQRRAIQDVKSGEAESVREALGETTDKTQQQFEALKRAWLKADDEARDMFWNWLDPLYIPTTFQRGRSAE